MAWMPARTRGGGLVVDILRERWRLATMYALHAAPMQPSGIVDLFHAAEKRNIPVFGDHVIYRECVVRHLSELFHGGFIARLSSRTATIASPDTFYALTDIARGLLAAIEPAIDHGIAIYPELVDLSRASRNLPPAITPAVALEELSPEVMIRVRRRAAVLIFGLLLQPPWTISILTGLSGGPLRPTALTEDVNALIAANADVLSTRRVSTSTIHRQLGRLRALGYVEQIDDPAGRNPHRPPGAPERASALTPAAVALLEALEPAADYAADHDAGMAMMARAVMRAKISASDRRTSAASGTTVTP